MKRTSAYNKRGIQWTLNSVREDLDFADDIGLLSSRHSDIQEKMDRLTSLASQIGMKVNVGKTKLMRLNTTSNQPITVNNQQLEEVDEFTHLGSKVSTDGDSGSDVSVRISKANQAFGTLNPVWKSTKLNVNQDQNFQEQCAVYPVVRK